MRGPTSIPRSTPIPACGSGDLRPPRANLSLPQDPDGQFWTTDRLQQVLVAPEEHSDWVAEFEVDLARSHEVGEPVRRQVTGELLA